MQGRRTRGAGVIALAAAFALLVAGSARADTVLLGPELGPEFVHTTSPVTGTIANSAAPGVITQSPFDGVITRWRLRGADAGSGPYTLRVLHQDGGAYVATGSDVSGAIAGRRIHTFPANLPIQQGDLIGLTYPGIFAMGVAPSVAATKLFWTGLNPLVDNAPPRAPDAMLTDDTIVGVNATAAENCVVPNVRGKTLKKAKRRLRGSGCRAGRVTRTGGGSRVQRQGRRAGTEHPPGTKVRLTVG